MFQEIRDSNGHLLAKIDVKRRLLQLKRKSAFVLVDLTPYLEGINPPPTVEEEAVQQEQ